MRQIQKLSNEWYFCDKYTENTDTGAIKPGYKRINLPYNTTEVSYNYFDEKEYQKTTAFFHKISLDETVKSKLVFIDFEGVMSYARVYLNGSLTGEHKGGYTPFSIRIDRHIDWSQTENILSVIADASERPEIPPFGKQVDYLTYSGIYRDVKLRICDPVYIENIKVDCKNPMEETHNFSIMVKTGNPERLNGLSGITIQIKNNTGSTIYSKTHEFELSADSDTYTFMTEGIRDLCLWDIDSPCLYTISVSLEHNRFSDTYEDRFGIRKAEFTSEGFYLNGKKVKLFGLNRHQSFPYIGYAMPKRAQYRDAEILKNELHLNMVRTSHYPQSVHFLDRCDELGLLVMEEIPGWQHVGEGEWKEIAKQNVREMIERDWNRPSIVLWGVRINESPDNDELYAATNEIAKNLDRSRQTGGVRDFTNSNLIEDVYTYNDFLNNGINEPLSDPRQITGTGKGAPYLVTEYNGHMFPTKRFDNEERVCEHVIRHLRVIDTMFGNDRISGSIGWCAFDYNTHKDFGSGDRICYHGVMDMFRRPKFAASVYSSQCNPDIETVLQPVTYWARGERSIGGILPLIILTNCDYIEFSFGDSRFGKKFFPDYTSFPNLPHPPVIITEKHLDGGNYGTWGMQWKDGRIAGYHNGSEVIVKKMSCDPFPHSIIVSADDTVLESETKDVSRITVRIVDQYENPLWFLNDIISVNIEGPASIQGPSDIVTICGEAVFWIETQNIPGEITITVSNKRCGSKQVKINVQ